MSINFGSVGDIIAVGQIAWSLAKALTDSKRSAKEYQGLIKELQTFDQALLQVYPRLPLKWNKSLGPDVFIRIGRCALADYDVSPELNHLGTITKDACVSGEG